MQILTALADEQRLAIFWAWRERPEQQAGQLPKSPLQRAKAAVRHVKSK